MICRTISNVNTATTMITESIYTRKEKFGRGMLIDLSVNYRFLSRRHYKLPVALTKRLWDLIKNSSDPLPDVINDILWMSHQYITHRIDAHTHEFQVIIHGAAEPPDHPNRSVPIYDMIIAVHGDDAMRPVITIMRSDEWNDAPTTLFQ